MAGDLDALDLHEIGRLVLGAGIGPRWDLHDLAHDRNGTAYVTIVDHEGSSQSLRLWNDGGPSTGGARAVAEEFLDELERAGFRIVRADRG